jgi:hypothetical protein
MSVMDGPGWSLKKLAVFTAFVAGCSLFVALVGAALGGSLVTMFIGMLGVYALTFGYGLLLLAVAGVCWVAFMLAKGVVLRVRRSQHQEAPMNRRRPKARAVEDRRSNC